MEKEKKFYLVAADMGYGHQRAAYPLIGQAAGRHIIIANNYPGISQEEKASWKNQRFWYELISYFKKVPIIGQAAFGLMDELQDIPPYYPRRPFNQTSPQQQFFFRLVKKGLGKKLIDQLNKKPLPLVCTFFVAAYFAEYWDYQGDIYCQICDTDLNRAWAPIKPATSRIRYLATTTRAVERLKLYGVGEKNIFLTGFPLPKENVGERRQILQADLLKRLERLDPQGVFTKKYGDYVKLSLGRGLQPRLAPLTITYAIGGAGAQRDLAPVLIRSLGQQLRRRQIKLHLVAGSRHDVNDYFQELKRQSGPATRPSLEVLFYPKKEDYFKNFNKLLRTTDILITKPSELSFYAGLGLPLIMTEPVGAQEEENRKWLIKIGAGLDAEDLPSINDWLFDWLNYGYLARAAWQGYLEAESSATYNILKIINRDL